MKRKRFLKLFGLGVASIATVKIVIDETDRLKPIKEFKEVVKLRNNLSTIRCGPGLLAQVEQANKRDYEMWTREHGMREFDKAFKEYAKALYNEHKRYEVDASTIPDNFPLDRFIKEYKIFQETGVCDSRLATAFNHTKII